MTEPNPRDLASLPVDELALWVLGRLCAMPETTFPRLQTLNKLLRGLGERIPTDGAYYSDRREEGPH